MLLQQGPLPVVACLHDRNHSPSAHFPHTLDKKQGALIGEYVPPSTPKTKPSAADSHIVIEETPFQAEKADDLDLDLPDETISNANTPEHIRKERLEKLHQQAHRSVSSSHVSNGARQPDSRKHSLQERTIVL